MLDLKFIESFLTTQNNVLFSLVLEDFLMVLQTLKYIFRV